MRTKKITLLAAAICGLTFGRQSSAEMPTDAMLAQCHEVASVGGTYSEVLMNACLKQKMEDRKENEALTTSAAPKRVDAPDDPAVLLPGVAEGNRAIKQLNDDTPPPDNHLSPALRKRLIEEAEATIAQCLGDHQMHLRVGAGDAQTRAAALTDLCLRQPKVSEILQSLGTGVPEPLHTAIIADAYAALGCRYDDWRYDLPDSARKITCAVQPEQLPTDAATPTKPTIAAGALVPPLERMKQAAAKKIPATPVPQQPVVQAVVPAQPAPLASTPNSAGFDAWCSKVKKPSSVAICSDPELRALAEQRNTAFQAARARVGEDSASALLADQKGWVLSYSAACGISEDIAPTLPLAPATKDCMARAGRARISYLENYGK